MDAREIGGNLRALRVKAGVGLRELSRRAETSPASLSAIEKGRTSPTLVTLHKVLKALGTNFAEFFAATDAPDEPVFPARTMRVIRDAHRTYVLLFPRREDLRFEMLRETFLPRERDSEWEIHDFDVGGVIVSGGPGRLEIDGVGSWTLRPGDAFYIKAGQKHRARNIGKRPLRQFTVMDPPRY